MKPSLSATCVVVLFAAPVFSQKLPVSVRSPDGRTSLVVDRTEAGKPGFDLTDATSFWDMTNKQDWSVCELSQAGISSPAYAPGPYSNREDLLYAFDRFIVEFHSQH